MLGADTDFCTAAAPVQVGGDRPRYLTDYSPQDKPWDVHRGQTQTVEGVYRGTIYDGLGDRLRGCSCFLGFAWAADGTGELRLRLRTARFCRVRHCPVCQWRRSLMWQARFLKALPGIEAAHPTARWLFLTLTVRNCAIVNLRQTLRSMNEAWQRLIKRREFAGNVQGWIRTTEVTRGHDDSAHPHFHCLLMVKPGYFAGKNYVTQSRWTDLWRECARLDYQPIVDIRTVKARRGAPGETPLRQALAETLKYAVKPSDMEGDWLIELTKQVHRLRFLASGGVLRNMLREFEASEQDLLLADEDGEGGDPVLFFDWRREIRRYVEKNQ